ncbi:MAG: integration host factor subunit beta [Chlamydiia bacterium]|nr:integration host factor subunit beta [Chlamydiia bacterium]MCB9093122.1 integration host factor subunit beta [Halobacteriovoraceae bacterium]
MKTITKKYLISQIARTQGLDPKTVQMIVQEFFTEILENLKKGDRFEFRDFGVFETVVRKKKIGRNPKKPDVPIEIPEKRTARFVPGQKMKTLVSKS